MNRDYRTRTAEPVVAAGAIVLETTWVCVTHGTVNAQGTQCGRC
ncbi:hypothetical protein [Spirillospora sp. NBC_01491]|nr:hypothetical protein [Spirillospora sp. NBC_01491]